MNAANRARKSNWCETCGGFLHFGRMHQCPPKLYVLDYGGEEGPEDATAVYAYDSEAAALKYVENADITDAIDHMGNVSFTLAVSPFPDFSVYSIFDMTGEPAIDWGATFQEEGENFKQKYMNWEGGDHAVD